MSEKITLPVARYVNQFLVTRFGEGPYDLSKSRGNFLRISFLSTHAQAWYLNSVDDPVPIELILGKDKQLYTYYLQQRGLFDRGLFMYFEFFRALWQEVELTKFLALEHGIRTKDMGYHTGIALFLDRHGIDEDMYSYDNAWRQFSRFKARLKYNQEKVEKERIPFLVQAFEKQLKRSP